VQSVRYLHRLGAKKPLDDPAQTRFLATYLRQLYEKELLVVFRQGRGTPVAKTGTKLDATTRGA
jgi:hypothetical protein